MQADSFAEAPAASLADIAAKSVVMKIQIAPTLDGTAPHECCCEQERLAWSMAEDAMRLAELERAQ